MTATLELVTPAVDLAVSLADAKAHLRVDGDDEDTLITACVRAATESAEADTGRAIMPQTWRLTLPRWPGCEKGFSHQQRIFLPRPPLLEVLSLAYFDAAGVLQALDVDEDLAIQRDEAFLAEVRPVHGTSWPAAACRPDAIQLTWSAGYATAADVPPLIAAAIRLLTAELYERREESISGTIINTVPLAAQRLLSRYRIFASGSEND